MFLLFGIVLGILGSLLAKDIIDKQRSDYYYDKMINGLEDMNKDMNKTLARISHNLKQL